MCVVYSSVAVDMLIHTYWWILNSINSNVRSVDKVVFVWRVWLLPSKVLFLLKAYSAIFFNFVKNFSCTAVPAMPYAHSAAPVQLHTYFCLYLICALIWHHLYKKWQVLTGFMPLSCRYFREPSFFQTKQLKTIVFVAAKHIEHKEELFLK